jgi:hypothetical protein
MHPSRKENCGEPPAPPGCALHLLGLLLPPLAIGWVDRVPAQSDRAGLDAA